MAAAELNAQAVTLKDAVADLLNCLAGLLQSAKADERKDG